MPNSAGFIAALQDALAAVGPLGIRKMFGGAALYLDGKVGGLHLR